MTSRLPQIDLARIRDYAGAKHRAFEELAYLLAWDLEGLDEGTAIERRATPDGGIEFSCVPDRGRGGRWAWQAKYLFRLDESAFRQMTKSVLSALKSTPDLERYIFVLPKDRSTAAMGKWNKAVKEWTKQAKSRQMSVDFEFRGESHLLTALTSDRHAGAIRYFFDERFLTDQFFARQVDREVENLGKRYDPRVNVETEARRIIDAACRGPRFVQELTSLIGALGDKRPHAGGSASLEQVVLDGVSTVNELLDEWYSVATPLLNRLNEPGRSVFAQLEEAVTRLRDGVDARSTLVDNRLDELNAQTQRAAARRRPPKSVAGSPKRRTKAQQAEDERKRHRDALETFSSSLYRLGRAIEEIQRFLESNEVAAATRGSVLLVGEAGCGKSHLVADLARERVATSLPSFLVLGQVLVQGALDPQLTSLVGLGSMTLADVLQALDVAARVRRNGRALLVIDAINEGAGADLWEHQLRGFVAEVAKHEWVALVITVRDVYENAVAPNGAGDLVRSVHHGLVGHEEEALALYADLYNLRLPDVPALLPELSNPLFLRSLCQSVQGRGMREIPREAASLVWVFDGLIGAVDETLGSPSRLDYGDWEKKVRRAVHAIASAMVDVGSESLPLSDAKDVCLTIHADQRNSYSLLNGLIVEGLLLRERAQLDDEPTETVRFTYQRLSDHLRADVLLERNSSDQELSAAVRNIARGPHPWAMSGLIAALVLLVPERRGKELATVLRLGKSVTADRYRVPRNPSTWLRREVQSAFVETLMWRSPRMFTSATRDLMERYLKAGFIESHEWLRIITGLACVPNHPLNMDWLHPILWRMSLPTRDAAWSRELLWVYSDDVNPIGRTVDWAWANPDAPEDVARLAGRLLAWLFTSPNRRLRDTATKALVSVTTQHPNVLAELVEDFCGVNDPYVLDRVVGAAYGHVLRCRHRHHTADTIDALIRLGQAVFDAVFGDDPSTHLMMRHRARSCIRVIDDVCRAAGHNFGRNLSSVDPPYGSSWPLQAVTARQLARGFGREYSGYLGSATELDWEFEETLERHVLADLALPDQDSVRKLRRRKLIRDRNAAMKALINAAPPSRRARVRRRAEGLITTRQSVTAPRPAARQAWGRFEESLSKAAREHARELHATVNALDRIDEETFHPATDLCTRWVAARVLDLGWTKDRFGDQDGHVGRWRGEQATEPIAKKYERIAFQELCGHLADHCSIDERWRNAPETYAGPWQIPKTLDLDPSLLVRGDQPESDTPAARLRDIRLRAEGSQTWWRTYAEHELNTKGTDDDWLSDTSDIPRPEDLLRVIDQAGGEWVALERHQNWSFKDPADLDRSYQQDRRYMWFRSQANIIRATDTEHPAWAASQNWMGLTSLSIPQDVSTASLGEYPDIAPWPSLLDLGDDERRPYSPEDDPGTDVLPRGWEFARTDDTTRLSYAIATVGYRQESGRDLSASDTPSAIMPSRMLLELLGAQWSGGRIDATGLDLGPVEREYSWVARDQVMAFCSAGREYGSGQALWVRAEPLREALAKAGLAMWSWTLGEKIYWTHHEPSSNRTDCFAGVRLAPGPLTVWGYTIERDFDRDHAQLGRRHRLYRERDPAAS